MHFFPSEYTPTILQLTSLELVKDPTPRLRTPLTEEEFRVFLGLLIRISLADRGRRRCHWGKVTEMGTDGLPGDDFGKFMALNRFDAILRCLTLGPPSSDTDPFLPVRAFAEAVGKRAELSIVPGGIITIDESMGQYTGDKMPGKMVVPRKPIPVGREYHTACDVESGICIAMEMVEGQVRDRQKEFAGELGVTTATTLRMSKPWWGTGRIFVGDSWFASVKTAIEMKKRGCDFVGMVKTAHAGFPVRLLHSSRGGNKGDLASATCKKDGIKLLAIRTTIISSRL